MQEHQTENFDEHKKEDAELFWTGVFILFLLASIAFFAVLFTFFKWHV